MEKIVQSRAKILGSIEEVDGYPMLHVAVGRVPLNSAAAAILSLCDGRRDPEQIVASIVIQRRGIAPEDARGFLEIAMQLGWNQTFN